MNREYAEKVEVLLRLLPIVMDEKVFAVHGGSAINLFVRDLPRYSIDIDLTYIPLEEREDKEFLYGFELGEPDWDSFDFHYFKDYPSVKWKLLNLMKLKKHNPNKIVSEAEKLKSIFSNP